MALSYIGKAVAAAANPPSSVMETCALSCALISLGTIQSILGRHTPALASVQAAISLLDSISDSPRNTALPDGESWYGKVKMVGASGLQGNTPFILPFIHKEQPSAVDISVEVQPRLMEAIVELRVIAHHNIHVCFLNLHSTEAAIAQVAL